MMQSSLFAVLPHAGKCHVLICQACVLANALFEGIQSTSQY